jgi:A/G-specific adenine glycosylase
MDMAVPALRNIEDKQMKNTHRKGDLIPDDFPVQEFRRELLLWFGTKARDLPWRNHPTLYGTWISEIMLQQTTVTAVVPYWEKFLAAFPTVKDLAEASETDVLAMWSGLGYYRRARNLHAAARKIKEEQGGCLPKTSQQWKELPGIGDYAAGAIASMGLAEVVPAIDVNARRVITRLFVDDVQTLPYLTPGVMQGLGLKLVDPKKPGTWNEALMELGALHCTARAAHCGECPVSGYCRAFAKGVVDEIPAPVIRQKARKVVTAQWLILTDFGIVVLEPGSPPVSCAKMIGEVVRDDFTNIHRGLWLLPQTAWFAESPELQPNEFLDQFTTFLDVIELSPATSSGFRPRFAGKFTHSITNHRIRVENLYADLRGIKKSVVEKSLKHAFTTFWAQQNTKSAILPFQLSFLPLNGNAAYCLPVSKMVHKACVLIKKTIS